MTGTVWSAPDYSSLVFAEWDGQYTLFQPLAGKTHYMNPAAVHILFCISDGAKSLDDICASLVNKFSDDTDQDFLTQVESALIRFDELGLVEKSG